MKHLALSRSVWNTFNAYYGFKKEFVELSATLQSQVVAATFRLRPERRLKPAATKFTRH